MSKEIELLDALLNDEPVEDFTPRSRMEAYLKNCCLACGCDGLPEPITETDRLLFALSEKMASGGGGAADEDVKIAYGTFTLAETIDVTYPNMLRIEHGLGVVPTFVMVVRNDNSQDGTSYLSACSIFKPSYLNGARAFTVMNDEYNRVTGNRVQITTNLPDENGMYVGCLGSKTACKLAACNYVWLAVGGVEL